MPKKKKSRKKTGKKNTLPKWFKWFCWGAGGLLVVAIVSGLILRRDRTVNQESVRIYIPTGSNFEAVADTLYANGILADPNGLNRMARMRHYTDHVKAGSYVVKSRMSKYDLVNKLRAGNQDPITVVIGRQRSMETLCRNLGQRFEFSGKELYRLVNNDSVCRHYGFSRRTMMAMFIQNSYEFYWTVSPTKFLDRMQQEYNRYWNSSRLAKCDALNLTPAEVTTIASIVEEETNVDSEKPLIASVYLNRVRKKMPLQADPTVRYAVGDFTLRRILKAHTQVDNPYNTYKYRGLPPGPICIPGNASIDAVLTNKKTNYLYFCAKEDFSGSHNFASTLTEHTRNAEKFHKALNGRKIYK